MNQNDMVIFAALSVSRHSAPLLLPKLDREAGNRSKA